MKNILEYLEATAAAVPEKLAFSDGKSDLSFGELQRASRAIGSALSRLGARREAVVVYMDKHPNVMSTFFGVIYAGCFYACIDPKTPADRVKTIVENLDAKIMIADSRSYKKAEAFEMPTLLRFEDVAASEIDDAALCAVRARQIDTDPIYVVFTSGSTGVPKGVVACHRSVIDYTEALCRAIGFTGETVFGNQTPLYFDAPLKEIMPTLKLGATTYFIPKMNFSFPVRLIEYLNTHKINTVCWVVSAFTQVSSLGAFDVVRPEYLHTVAFGSEVFPKKDYRMWREMLPNARFFNLYGPTEATGMSCFWSAERELSENEPIPIGRPFDNTDILLITDEGREAAYGEEGEICIRGTCVTMGYYNNSERTSEAFVQNPLNSVYPELIYKTGDIGKYNEHGELVFLTRRDSQIKHMGHRIELGEIEAALLTSPDAKRACCCYDKDARRIVLFYVGDMESADVQKYLKEKLPAYMLPAVCERLDVMPLTDNGKIDRRSLRERAMII